MRTPRTRKPRRTTRLTRIGVNPAAAVFLAFAFLAAPSLATPEKPIKQPEPVSFISGTVYRPPGFSLPGAEVRVVPEQPKSGNRKIPKLTALTDARGEFVFRVPPVPMKYTVTVQKKGFVSQSKTVEIEHEQHRELPFTLEPESGKE